MIYGRLLFRSSGAVPDFGPFREDSSHTVEMTSCRMRQPRSLLLL